MRSLYIFPAVACDARHLGYRSQGALLGVVESKSVGCGLRIAGWDDVGRSRDHGWRAQAPRATTTTPTSPRKRTAMDEWPVICWPDTLDIEAPLRSDGSRTTTQTLP